MRKIIMLKWLPASGKTTRAKEMLEKYPNQYKRVNKDDLRAMLDDGVYMKGTEKFILAVRDMVIMWALKINKSVIVDDTNLNPIHYERLEKLASDNGARFEIKEFDVSVDECIKRDRNRQNSVGKDIILGMFHKWIVWKINKPNPNGKIVICDVDWTLAQITDRSPYDWDKVDTDIVVEPVKMMVEAFQKKGYKIAIFTWRDWSCEEKTIGWLQDNNIYFDYFYIRKEWDNRRDYIVKKEFLDDFKKEDIFAVIDDRPQVIRMWQQQWLYVINVWTWVEF